MRSDARTKPEAFVEMGLVEGDRFLDLGSCFGEEIEMCVEHKIEVHSFEPHPDRYCDLAERWCGHELVTLNNAAAMPFNGTVELYEPRRRHSPTGSTTQMHKSGALGGRKFKVRAVDLSEYIKKHGPFDVIKMDIEGAEWEVLAHCLDTGQIYNAGQIWLEDHCSRIDYQIWRDQRTETKERFSASGIQIKEWP